MDRQSGCQTSLTPGALTRGTYPNLYRRHTKLTRSMRAAMQAKRPTLESLWLQETYLQPQFLPHRVHALLHLVAHLDLRRPGAVEAFGLPFARGVDAHLRAVVWL